MTEQKNEGSSSATRNTETRQVVQLLGEKGVCPHEIQKSLQSMFTYGDFKKHSYEKQIEIVGEIKAFAQLSIDEDTGLNETQLDACKVIAQLTKYILLANSE